MRKFISSFFASKPSPAKTEGYKPQFPRRWFMTPRDLPAFTFETIYSMLIDPQIRLCLAMRRAPLYGMQLAYQAGVDDQGKLKYEYGVQCRNPAVAAWIERQINTIWQTHLPAIATSQVWGWSGGEITVKLSDHNLVEIDRLLPRHAADVILMKRSQKRSGITVKRVANVGEVELEFPYCWFHSFNPEAGEDYGNPILLGAYSPWCDKWLNGAALDTRKLYMHKDAYGGMKVGYPEEMIPVAGSNTPLPARDIALQIAEQRTAGGVITYPSTKDHSGNPKWIIDEATVSSNPAHILQYPKDLDDEMRHGMEIPDDVISSDGAGGWAGKRVAMAAFYSGLDDWIVQILSDFKPVIDGLMMLNWGKCFDYNLSHKPLGAVAMEQQAGAGGFQSQPQSQPQQPQQSNQPDKGSFSFPFKMSAVGDWKSERKPECSEKKSCVMLPIDFRPAAMIMKLQSNIDQEDVIELEGSPHITAKYGLETNNSNIVAELLSEFGEFSSVIDGCSLFQNPEHDVLKLDVSSARLMDLNELLCSLPHCDTFPVYHPHITIAYLKPGTGQKYIENCQSLNGLSLDFSTAIFSDKSSQKSVVNLKKKE